MIQTNVLGEYLRARRDLLRPEDVGLPSGGRRRVPGLRREEVALLAGISSEYYLRLEQGRDQHPSAQVLQALARVLMLDADATAQLTRLARPRPRRPHRRSPERVGDGLRRLVMGHTTMPAFVHGRYLDVLAANPMATALSPSLRPGANLLRAVFLDAGFRALHDDWRRAAGDAVAAVRRLAGPETLDARLTELVGELAVRSEEFRRWWARPEVRMRNGGVVRMRHPQVGPLELDCQRLAAMGAEGQVLVVYHAAPGGDSAQRLSLLAHLAAGDAPVAAASAGPAGPSAPHV
ncbi:helix-turn-helix domain-containing protein [Streptantibioticus cattleyicolor]|uniref:DNA-binding protein n=1 Tax=Streptantibioticus cattleyicolor (strain ATCC 35852 / DSM 46488 / JCM 4925 / NBRC 14057 / NRRL 8057) TaxID=1003195 RepID=F8JIW4_STREN|nr:helix-turn-helix transcriptional regulator [Streptantibioticus cattleyicolor]AEW98951.1 DNA-binding protein [Streptantibioticus cattleyicolor NRRL 8057 = DSM 46488]CCB72003.1 Helix-turn-helix protein [Streptantibioticus cattleyicolor NRRL 8057 = DSM 46488]